MAQASRCSATTLLALALASCLALTAADPAAAALGACAPGLSAEQCTICALAKAPAVCHACVKARAAPANETALTAQACLVCGSLDAAEQQGTCTACVKAYGYNAGCSVCGGAALYDIPANTKPTAKGLATAAGCYSCYAKAGKDLQATPACAACWGPAVKDPAACSSCVAGATGVPAAGRAGCFACHLKSQADPAGCAACLKSAGSPPDSLLCRLCPTDVAPGKREQGQCYSCMASVKASLPAVRWLCHVTGTADKNAPTKELTAAIPAYFRCLAAAPSAEGGKSCRMCMDAIEKGGPKAGDACFAKLA